MGPVCVPSASYWEGLARVRQVRGSAPVAVNLESVMHVPSLVTFYLYQPKKRKGTWLSKLMFYVSTICQCCWRQCLVCGSLCSWPYQCPMCIFFCVCMCLRATSSALLLVEPKNCVHWPGADTLWSGVQWPDGTNPWAKRYWRWQLLITSLNKIVYIFEKFGHKEQILWL